MGKFLRLTYDLPVENAGLAQAAAIKLGGIAIGVGLIEDVPTYTKNAPKQLGAPKRAKSGKGKGPIVLTIIEDELAKGNEVHSKTIKALAKKRGITPTTVQYYLGIELSEKRLLNAGKRGTYRRPQPQ